MNKYEKILISKEEYITELLSLAIVITVVIYPIMAYLIETYLKYITNVVGTEIELFAYIFAAIICIIIYLFIEMFLLLKKISKLIKSISLN